jgi:hypothetical protein
MYFFEAGRRTRAEAAIEVYRSELQQKTKPDRGCGMYILALRAETGPSLRAQADPDQTPEADIQINLKPVYTLRCRKAAPSLLLHGCFVSRPGHGFVDWGCRLAHAVQLAGWVHRANPGKGFMQQCKANPQTILKWTIMTQKIELFSNS